MLTSAELDRVFTACGLEPDLVVTCEELSGGNYNSVYRLRTGDATYVLKVAPDPDSLSMTYERDLMSTEAVFYREAAATVPVPGLVHAAPDFLLMTEIPGRPWYGQRIDPAGQARLRGELGELVAAQHRITGVSFGYPQMGLQRTWRVAFQSMMDAVLGDAKRYGVRLPMPATRIASVLRDRGEAFDDVTRPALVHFDLWDGNILLDRGRISGLIDGERAFWGDPLAEMVSLALFGDIEKDEAFLASYRGAGGQLDLDPAARFRLAAYRVYLYLIMLVETVPRGRTGPASASWTRFIARHLTGSFEALGS